MLIYQPLCAYYGNFNQAFNEACEYTQTVEQTDDRSTQRNQCSSKIAKKKILPGHKTPTGVFCMILRLKEHLKEQLHTKKGNIGKDQFRDEWSSLFLVFTLCAYLYAQIDACTEW